MKKIIKKAFTLVELLVVIAILAVLATVSVIGYSSFTNKAKQANDTSLLTELNNYVLGYKALSTKNDIKTPNDLIDALSDSGYDVSKLAPYSTDCHYGFDVEQDKFVMFHADEVTVPEGYTLNENKQNIFVFADSETTKEYYEDLGYGIYRQAKCELESPVAIKGSYDDGVHSETVINYTNSGNAQTVIIRTDLGKLTIDGAKDTVSHYGEVENVNIVAVDKVASYHEYGKVGYVEIKEGHFVAESDSKIIALVNTGSNTDVKIDADSTATIQQAITTNSAASGTAHGGNVSLTSQTLTTEEKNEIIYHAEATVFNALIVDETYYKSLDDVFVAVKNANGKGYDLSGYQNITLLKDQQGGGFFIETTKAYNLVIDFNGYTYTVNGAVGSAGTPTQAMHFVSKGSVTLKNGNFIVAKNTENPIKMAMQCYCTFNAENMIFDFSNISVQKYDDPSYETKYPDYYMLEVPMFNNNGNNGNNTMTLTDSTITFPENSVKGINNECTVILNNTKINGYVCLSSDSKYTSKFLIDNESSVNEVVSYFAKDSVTSNTSENQGYTTYSLGN